MDVVIGVIVLGSLLLLALVIYLIYRFLKWLFSGPSKGGWGSSVDNDWFDFGDFGDWD